MGRKGKTLVIATLGLLIIIVAGVASAGNNRSGNPAGSAENPAAGAENPAAGAESPAAGAGGTDGIGRSQGNADENLAEIGAGKDPENYLREQDTIMADMMRDMEDIPETGSADLDFLHGMIPHHESAVAMAESFLKNGGQNEKLVALADDIIEVQKKEIDQMKSMIERLEKSGKRDEEKEEAYLKEYRKMFDSHQMDHSGVTAESGGPAQDHMTLTGTVDGAFAGGMILHHQMAVDMAEAILDYTEDEEVEALALAIVGAQETEIREMQEILNGLPRP